MYDIGSAGIDHWYYPDVSYKSYASIETILSDGAPWFGIVKYDMIYLLDEQGNIKQIVDIIHKKYSSEIVALELLGVSPTEYVLVAATIEGNVMALDNPLASMPSFEPTTGVQADSEDTKTGLEAWKEKGSILVLGVIPIIAVLVILRKKK